jgi:hypothetical protein
MWPSLEAFVVEARLRSRRAVRLGRVSASSTNSARRATCVFAALRRYLAAAVSRLGGGTGGVRPNDERRVAEQAHSAEDSARRRPWRNSSMPSET